jgi:formylglycine-generating enzyme required for sulfatase activity
MHGNVPEWCWDWYDSYPVEAVSDPTGPLSALQSVLQGRVLRGGTFQGSATGCRSARRFVENPMYVSGGAYGFRVLCGR